MNEADFTHNELEIDWESARISKLEQKDRDFLKRVYSGDFSRYVKRLNKIGFSGLGDILDAGAGFGQWSIALASLGNEVWALDADIDRSTLLAEISSYKENTNKIFSSLGNLENLPYSDLSFDAIFSFSSVYFSDYQQTIVEFGRVLRKGGHLYVNSNDIGWYLFLLLSGHNQTKGYNPRMYALRSLFNTFTRKRTGFSETFGTQFIPAKKLRQAVEAAGMDVLDIQEDGKINQGPGKENLSFLPGKFLGFRAAYELLAVKS